MLTDLMGPEFRPGTEMACPCPMTSGVSRGKPHGEPWLEATERLDGSHVWCLGFEASQVRTAELSAP